MTNRTCNVDDCERVEQLRRGMCSLHYFRWKRYGSTAERYRHCPKNHVLSPENIGRAANGTRYCRLCAAQKDAPDPCTIDDCADAQLARGWCRKHYLRWYRLGDTGTPPRFTPKACAVEDCEKQAIKHGLCSKHFERWKKHGTTDDPPPRPTECSIEGCGRKPQARGWCKPHYKQLTGQGSAHEMKRYALKRGSTVESVSYELILDQHGMVCHICGDGIPSLADLNMDHVIPLARAGTHTYDNIRPSHKTCNQRKHTKLVAEFLAEAGPTVT